MPEIPILHRFQLAVQDHLQQLKRVWDAAIEGVVEIRPQGCAQLLAGVEPLTHPSGKHGLAVRQFAAAFHSRPDTLFNTSPTLPPFETSIPATVSSDTDTLSSDTVITSTPYDTWRGSFDLSSTHITFYELDVDSSRPLGHGWSDQAVFVQPHRLQCISEGQYRELGVFGGKIGPKPKGWVESREVRLGGKSLDISGLEGTELRERLRDGLTQNVLAHGLGTVMRKSNSKKVNNSPQLRHYTPVFVGWERLRGVGRTGKALQLLFDSYIINIAPMTQGSIRPGIPNNMAHALLNGGLAQELPTEARTEYLHDCRTDSEAKCKPSLTGNIGMLVFLGIDGFDCHNLALLDPSGLSRISFLDYSDVKRDGNKLVKVPRSLRFNLSKNSTTQSAANASRKRQSADPLDDSSTFFSELQDVLNSKAFKPSTLIIELLQDQSVFSGIGTSEACDVLYRSCLHPTTLVIDIVENPDLRARLERGVVGWIAAQQESPAETRIAASTPGNPLRWHVPSDDADRRRIMAVQPIITMTREHFHQARCLGLFDNQAILVKGVAVRNPKFDDDGNLVCSDPPTTLVSAGAPTAHGFQVENFILPGIGGCYSPFLPLDPDYPDRPQRFVHHAWKPFLSPTSSSLGGHFLDRSLYMSLSLIACGIMPTSRKGRQKVVPVEFTRKPKSDVPPDEEYCFGIPWAVDNDKEKKKNPHRLSTQDRVKNFRAAINLTMNRVLREIEPFSYSTTLFAGREQSVFILPTPPSSILSSYHPHRHLCPSTFSAGFQMHSLSHPTRHCTEQMIEVKC
ncbi:hypothetical protein T439DRAFT_320194 [Meredithblackwellia eburnea MCA 4105]